MGKRPGPPFGRTFDSTASAIGALALALTLGAGSIALAGSAAGPPAPVLVAQTAIPTPQQGGTLRFALVNDPRPYPIVAAGGFNTLLVQKTMFNGLTRPDPQDSTPTPDLATSWTASPDLLTWTFQLRRGVTWHDGRPFTAADVKFTFDTMMDPKVNARYRGNSPGLRRTEVVDDHTIRMVFDAPLSPLPAMLAYNAYIVPKHLLEDQDLNAPAEFYRRPVGTGPFRFKEQVRGSHFTVEANPRYFEGRPHLDAIVFKVLPDPNTQVAQFRAGELDLTWLEAPLMPALKAVPGIRIDFGRQVNYYMVDLNNRLPIFADRRVRQAVAHAIDRKAIIEQVFLGTAELANGPISPILKPHYTAEVTSYPYDPAKAKRLLGEAGWTPGTDGLVEKGGRRLAFTLESYAGTLTDKMAVVVHQYLRQVGMDVKLQHTNLSQMYEKVLAGKHEAMVGWWITPSDADQTVFWRTGGDFNTSGYANPEVDRLLAEGRATVDVGKRAAAYHRLQKILADDVPYVFLCYPLEIRAVAARVQGLAPVGLRDGLAHAHRLWLKP
ncbi:MAG: ABC transporter substrate-binding protein [Candidatus Rokuibacteriota bacterium]